MSTYVGSLQDLVQLKLLLMKPNQTLQSTEKTQLLMTMLDTYMKRDSVDLRQELDRFQASPSQPINPSILNEMKRLDGILSSIINGSSQGSLGSSDGSSQGSLGSSQDSSDESSQGSLGSSDGSSQSSLGSSDGSSQSSLESSQSSLESSQSSLGSSQGSSTDSSMDSPLSSSLFPDVPQTTPVQQRDPSDSLPQIPQWVPL